MRETFTSGSVGRAPGNRCLYPEPPPAPDRAWQQQCQALSHRQRPHPLVEAGRPRFGDGTLLCPAQLPGALDPVAGNDL